MTPQSPPLQRITTVLELRRVLEPVRLAGRTIGLVPTMGALHEGHLSLVRACRAECDVAVVSIYVNPSQFGPKEDLARYPRTLDADLEALADCGTDLAYVPTSEEVYPPGYSTWVEVGPVARPLEGECRPGHFRGVATIVLKLLNMVGPQIAYFGQKDLSAGPGDPPPGGRPERAGRDPRPADRPGGGRLGDEFPQPVSVA